MKVTKTLFILLIVLLGNFYATAQESDRAEILIVNKWLLKSYELNGEIFPPREQNKNDRMIF
jgi:hypothetical protein